MTIYMSTTKWDEAIADAKRKINKLRLSIRVFEARKNAGDSFPSMSQSNRRPGKAAIRRRRVN